MLNSMTVGFQPVFVKESIDLIFTGFGKFLQIVWIVRISLRSEIVLKNDEN